MSGLRHDLVFALRGWRQRPALTTVTVLALAFGIAATSLAFAVLNTFLLQPLPVANPDRVVRLYSSYAQGFDHFTVSHPDFEDLRALTAVFAGVIAEEPVPFGVVAGSRAERVYGDQVAGGYFSVLGLRPAAGRFFTEAEEATASPCVVVLAYDFWRQQFGGDRGALGRQLTVNGRSCEIIGVAPPGFRGTTAGVRPDLWRPLGPDRKGDRGGRGLFVGARLQPGVSVEQARAAVDVLARQLQQQYPSTNSGVRFPVLSEFDSRIHPVARGGIAGASGAFVAAGGLVLLLACANAAAVMLIAAFKRRREIGVRLAMGAGRTRVVRQLFSEAMLLAVAAGVIGIGLAWSATTLLASIELPLRIPVSFDFAVDGGVLLIGVAAILVTAIACGVIPALYGTRVDIVSMLKNDGPSAVRPSRVRIALVALQMALALTLLMAGGVFLRSLLNAQRLDVGFNPRGVVTVAVDPGLHGYSEDGAAQFWTKLKAAVLARPGAVSLTFASTVPFELNITRLSIGPEGYRPTPEQGWPSIDWASVGPDYFKTLEIPVVDGREFTAFDDDDAPAIAIVNDELARRFWPNQRAVGQRLVTPSGSVTQVVGVVRRSRYLTIGEEAKPHVYFRFPDRGARAARVLLRTSGDVQGALSGLRETIASLDPALPVFNAATMEQQVRGALLPAWSSAAAVAIVAIVAMLLASLGLYASVAHVVSMRVHEIGVRTALGARPRQILSLVLRQGTTLVAVGGAAGIAAGLAAARLLQAIVYDVSPADPLVVIGAPLVLVLACAISAGLAAAAALRIDPARALRTE